MDMCETGKEVSMLQETKKDEVVEGRMGGMKTLNFWKPCTDSARNRIRDLTVFRFEVIYAFSLCGLSYNLLMRI